MPMNAMKRHEGSMMSHGKGVHMPPAVKFGKKSIAGKRMASKGRDMADQSERTKLIGRG